MRKRVLQFNPKIFIKINFTNLIINWFVFTFPYSIKINTSLLLVLTHNTLIHIQFSMINFVSCRYDTLLIFYITWVLSTLAEGTNNVISENAYTDAWKFEKIWKFLFLFIGICMFERMWQFFLNEYAYIDAWCFEWMHIWMHEILLLFFVYMRIHIWIYETIFLLFLFHINI